MAASNISLDEKYAFLKQAGKGTYGTTWIAEDKATKEKVAIKAISKTHTSRKTSSASSSTARVSLSIQTSSPLVRLPLRPRPPMSWSRTMHLVVISLMQSNQKLVFQKTRQGSISTKSQKQLTLSTAKTLSTVTSNQRTLCLEIKKDHSCK